MTSDIPRDKIRPVMSITPLASCPFCGSKAVENWRSADDEPNAAPGTWTVFCTACEAEGPHDQDEELARQRWNERIAMGVLSQIDNALTGLTAKAERS